MRVATVLSTRVIRRGSRDRLLIIDDPHQLGPDAASWSDTDQLVWAQFSNRLRPERTSSAEGCHAGGFPKIQIESLLAWILVGMIVGARIYVVVQNDFLDYLSHPWRIAALWEGGLVAGGILAASGCEVQALRANIAETLLVP